MAANLEMESSKSPKEGNALEDYSDSDLGDGDSDGESDGDAQADGGGSDSPPPAQPVEWLATNRARRSTAGNRMKAMIANEEAAGATPDGDDELELLFAEDANEDDVGFTIDNDKEDASDVQMDSSSDDEDDNAAADADDLLGEKELERQARQQRAAERKRKRSGQDAIPAKFRKKKRVRIEEQPGTGTGTGTATPTSSAAPGTATATALAAGARSPASQQPRPRPKKKSERVSWLPNAADMPTRASERHTTRISKEQLHHRMVADEKRRIKVLEQMERKAALAEATKRPPLTQAERLAEAALVERRNAKSLNRWEEAEKQREEERLRKIAALNSRKLDGPVVTFWSGIQELGAVGEGEGARDKHVGLMVAMEERPQRKKRQSLLAAAVPAPAPAPNLAAATPADTGIQADGTTSSAPPASASASVQKTPNPVTSAVASTEVMAPPPAPVSPFARATLAPPAQSPAAVLPSSAANPNLGPPLAPFFTNSSLAPPDQATTPLMASTPQELSFVPVHVPVTPSSTSNPDQKQVPPAFLGPQVPASPSQKDQGQMTSHPSLGGSGASSQVLSISPHAIQVPPPSLSSPAAAPDAMAPPAVPLSQPPVHVPASCPAQSLAPAAGPFYHKAIFAPVPPTALTVNTNITVLAGSEPLKSTPAPATSALSNLTTTPSLASVPAGPGQIPPTPTTAKPKPARKSKKAGLTPEVLETPAAETPDERPLEGKVTRSCIILQNFDDDAIKDRQVQTQILFGRKMNKLGRPAHAPLCVVTNHPARYRDPKTGLPYYNGHAYREIQRLYRGDFKWSRLMGAWVGLGKCAASNVPERFLDPSKKRTTTPTPPQQAKSEELGGTSSAAPAAAAMGGTATKPVIVGTVMATADATGGNSGVAPQTASSSVAPAPAPAPISFPTQAPTQAGVPGQAAGNAPLETAQASEAVALPTQQPAPQLVSAQAAPVPSSPGIDHPVLPPAALPTPLVAANPPLPPT